ncbi:hypothetical protein KTT_30800 [Tengunoibacter tsumagoiensis]|uniref:Uncharacterized protein n=1 Tax=Tengunoibacter tsumagoiensis TaxID=2014871 RepID=A0A402A2J7_9CHLR|nr:hypothetical protein KTT_30800 [Tengunoibacter tsumagoiensis]
MTSTTTLPTPFPGPTENTINPIASKVKSASKKSIIDPELGENTHICVYLNTTKLLPV